MPAFARAQRLVASARYIVNFIFSGTLLSLQPVAPVGEWQAWALAQDALNRLLLVDRGVVEGQVLSATQLFEMVSSSNRIVQASFVPRLGLPQIPPLLRGRVLSEP